MLTRNWDLYDTRHAVFQPVGMSPEALERGFNWINTQFGTWSSIWRAAATKPNLPDRLRHLLFSSGLRQWKRVWAWMARHRCLHRLVPLLESVLSAFGRYPAQQRDPIAAPTVEQIGRQATVGAGRFWPPRFRFLPPWIRRGPASDR
ncbi:MAG: hypothetical protein ABFD92_09125 [Planctomycetaceae bacterium]|nr:hypothetical protein [Planctomycetaceae bacterium]